MSSYRSPLPFVPQTLKTVAIEPCKQSLRLQWNANLHPNAAMMMEIEVTELVVVRRDTDGDISSKQMGKMVSKCLRQWKVWAKNV
jgi:hypothetical protein